jgi:membrane protease subunit HflC
MNHPGNDDTMRNRTSRWIGWAVALVFSVGLTWSSFVAVDETEYVVVTSFGRVVVVHGLEPGSAGLHFKSPWQSVARVDRRIRAFDPPAREVITGDKRNLEVASYVVYRVADPVRFLGGSGSMEEAEARLNERIAAALSDSIGRRDLASLATTDRAKWALDDLTREAAGAVSPAARAELGVDLLDLGIRRFNHPLEVRPAVFELIRSERRQVAARFRAEGEARFTAITSQADRTRDAILAQADAESERIRGQAQAEATRILNDAHRRDPRFYELLRTLESYASILDARTTIVLSSSSPLLKLLARGPGEESAPETPRPVPEASAPLSTKLGGTSP